MAVVSAVSCGDGDGIGDYSKRLVDELRKRDSLTADLYVRGRHGGWTSIDGRRRAQQSLVGELHRYDAVLLQYNPFMYGRWGVAPWLPLMVGRVSRSKPRPTLAIMVHEPYVAPANWRWMLMGAYQRLQLRALERSADVIFASIQAWAEQLARDLPSRLCLRLPVASSLPDMRQFRDEERASLGIDSHRLVLTAFGSSHPSRHAAYIVRAANALTASGRRVALLNLGATPLTLDGLDRSVWHHAPGPLSTNDLARRLATTDIFLAPFVDGVSARRTTLMAALQHGLPVVGTDGPLTDALFRQAPMALSLAPVGRDDLFVAAVDELARQPREREALGERGRKLYVETFDWPLLVGHLLEALERARPRR